MLITIGRKFESRNRILGGSFWQFTFCKIVLLFEQTESILKRGSGRHNFLKSANHLNTLKCTKLGTRMGKKEYKL